MASKPKPAAAETQDDEAAEGDAQPANKKRFALPSMPSMKVLIIAGAALLVVAGGGGGAYFMFFKGHAEAKAAPPVPKPTVFVDLPEVLVNLSNPGSDRTQYLKIKVVLELPEQKMIEQITPIMPRVMDAFQTYLRELRPSDLDGSAGLYRLREELTRRVNAAIEPAHVNAVLFKELVIQ